MKNFKSILVAMVLASVVMVFSCKENKSEADTETQTETVTENISEEQGKEYTSAYVCPMHCKDSGSASEGNCGTCGMSLVKNEDHNSNGHKH